MKLHIQLLLLLSLVGCSSTKNVTEVDLNFTNNLKIDKNDLQIITPHIEIKEKRNGKFLATPVERKKLRNVILQTTKSMFPNAPYVEVMFMYRDAYTINLVLEREVSYKKRKAPKEVLTTGKRYSILISTNNYFGELERGVINLFLIDNEKETLQLLKHYQYKHSPLQTEKFKRKILKVLQKL
ncbi:hypothetical protein [Kordia antarctica]|nr:hypothetical protein [Kordia antarctica]